MKRRRGYAYRRCRGGVRGGARVADGWHAGPLAVLKAGEQLMTADIRAKLSWIDAPTLLVWGECDTVVPVEIGRQLLHHLRHADLVVVPSAGHNPM